MKTIANNILIPEIGRLLDEGMEVTLRAKGRSMNPYIRDGKDSLVLKKMADRPIGVEDIVLAKVADGRFVIHRVVRIDGDELTLMGDGNLYGTEQCRRQDVMGKLIFIERNGRRIECNTRAQQRKARLLRTLYRTARKAYAALRRPLRKKKQ